MSGNAAGFQRRLIVRVLLRLDRSLLIRCCCDNSAVLLLIYFISKTKHSRLVFSLYSHSWPCLHQVSISSVVLPFAKLHLFQSVCFVRLILIPTESQSLKSSTHSCDFLCCTKSVGRENIVCFLILDQPQKESNESKVSVLRRQSAPPKPSVDGTQLART